MTFTANAVPAGKQESFEVTQIAASNSCLVFAASAYYYITLAQVGNAEATDNLWIIKSTDGVTWSLVYNNNRGHASGFYALAVTQIGNSIYILAQPFPVSPSGTSAAVLFTFNAGADTFSADSTSPLYGGAGGGGAENNVVDIVAMPDGSLIGAGGSSPAGGRGIGVARYASGVWGSVTNITTATTATLQAMVAQTVTNVCYVFYDDTGGFKCCSVTSPTTLGTIQTVSATKASAGCGIPCIVGSDSEVLIPVSTNPYTMGSTLIVYRAACAQNPTFSTETVQSGIAGQSPETYTEIASAPAAAIWFDGSTYVFYPTSNQDGIVNPNSATINATLYLQTNTGPTLGWGAAQAVQAQQASSVPIAPYPALNASSLAVMWGVINPPGFFGPGSDKYNSLAMTLYVGSAGPLSLSCNNPPSGTVGTAYSHALSVSGGVAPFTYAIIGGSLPSGLGFLAGTISGIPAVTGTYTFSTAVFDSQGTEKTVSCSITINAAGGGGGGGGGTGKLTQPSFTLQKMVVAMRKERWLPVRGAGTAAIASATTDNAMVLRKVNVVLKRAPYTPVRGAAQ